MELTIMEIMVLGQVIPQKGNYIELLLSRSVQKKADLTEKDRKEMNFRFEDGMALWNDDSFSKDIPLTDEEVAYVKNTLRELSEKNELTIQSLTLYEKVSDFLSKGGK